MNTLVSTKEELAYQQEKKNEFDSRTFGDIFAVSVVGLYTFSGLVVSCWSAILLLTGNTSGPNPLAYIVDLLKISGLIS